MNAILNKQFLRRAFELPPLLFDRWLQGKIRRDLIRFKFLNGRVESRHSRNEQRIGLFNSLDKIEHVLKIIERLTGKPLRAKC